MLLFVLLFIVTGVVAGVLIGRLLPPKVQRAVIITLSLLCAGLHIYFVQDQLSTVGFAGAVRDPNYFYYYLGYGLAVAGLLNIWLCFKSRVVSATLLAAMIVLLPVLYFGTW